MSANDIPLSLVALDFGHGDSPRFVPSSDLGHYVREHQIYPRDGTLAVVGGGKVSSVLRVATLHQIEGRINELVVELQKARSRQHAAIERAAEIASSSEDGYELHYLANMFIMQKEVLRAVARNPNLSEKTQMLLVSLPEFQRDREIQLGLAHNPSLSASAMERMLGYHQDAFVLQGLAHNAARQSQSEQGRGPFAEICAELAMVDWDFTLSKAAIPGVKDPEVLRDMAQRYSAIFAADKLAVIAQNPNTPDSVLEKMASAPLARLQQAIGMDYAVKARHTLEAKRAHPHDQEFTFLP